MGVSGADPLRKHFCSSQAGQTLLQGEHQADRATTAYTDLTFYVTPSTSKHRDNYGNKITLKGMKGSHGYTGYKGEKGQKGMAGSQGPPGQTERGSPGANTTISSPEGCGGSGWRRVTFINMTDPTQNCPQGLNLTSYSKRSCGRAGTERRHCSSVTFIVGAPQYSQVCGRTRAHQFG